MLSPRAAGSGTQVVVPYRGDDMEWRHLKPAGDLGMVAPVPCNPKESLDSVRRAIAGSDIVINLMGKVGSGYPTSQRASGRARLLEKGCGMSGGQQWVWNGGWTRCVRSEPQVAAAAVRTSTNTKQQAGLASVWQRAASASAAARSSGSIAQAAPAGVGVASAAVAAAVRRRSREAVHPLGRDAAGATGWVARAAGARASSNRTPSAGLLLSSGGLPVLPSQVARECFAAAVGDRTAGRASGSTSLAADAAGI